MMYSVSLSLSLWVGSLLAGFVVAQGSSGSGSGNLTIPEGVDLSRKGMCGFWLLFCVAGFLWGIGLLWCIAPARC